LKNAVELRRALEVYKTVKDFERGDRDRAAWSDGRFKERF
jgi:hypothetical protein